MSSQHSSRLALIAAFAFLAPGLTRAAEFTLVIHETPAESARRADTGVDGQAYWAAYRAVRDAMQAAGALRGGAVLGDAVAPVTPSTATASPSIDMPRLGGYFVLDVADMDAALGWAARIPAVERGGRVDVHPAYPAPAMR